jgi:hypothetical protein
MFDDVKADNDREEKKFRRPQMLEGREILVWEEERVLDQIYDVGKGYGL